MQKIVKIIAVVFLTMGLAQTGFTQKSLIEGPITVIVGETNTYSITRSFIAAPMWSIVTGSGTIHSTWANGSTYYASISRTTSGKIAFYDEVSGFYSERSITIMLGAPTPVDGTRCGPGSVVLSATPGAGGNKVRWYSASAGGTFLAETNTYTTPVISTTMTYYVESWNSTTGQVSPRVPVTASVTTSLSAATGPGHAVCALEEITLTAQPASGGTTCRWYDAPTGGALVGTGLSYHVPSVSSGTSFYVTSYNPDGGCESSTRTAINISVNPAPSLPTSISHGERCGDGSVTLTASPGSPGHTVLWYSSPVGGEELHSGSSFTTPVLTETTGYFVASWDEITDCYSAGRTQVIASVYEKPGIASAHSVGTIYGSGSAELWGSHGAYFQDGIQVYWGDSNVDTTRYRMNWYNSLSNAENQVNKLGSGVHFVTPPISTTMSFYVRAQDKQTNCSGDIGEVIATVVPFATSARVQTDIIHVHGKKDDSSIATLTDSEKVTVNTYLDGRGWVRQQVVLRGSPNGKDIVSVNEFDSWGRNSKKYLPYAASTTDGSFHSSYTAELTSFYSQSGDKVANDASPFNLSVYEDSPLGRLKEQGGIGTARQPGTGKTNRVAYGFNTGAVASEAEEVRKFNSDLSSPGFYEANKLERIETIDPDGNKEIVFKDSKGNIIAKKTQLDKTTEGVMVAYIQTYYCYNEFGQLKFIIQPKGVAALKSSGWIANETIRNQYIYQFNYDRRGRLIERKVPGSGWEYLVYDQLDRLVLTQDANQRSQNKWGFVKYDGKGRPVMTGYYTDNENTSRSSLQLLLDGKNYNSTDQYFEIKQSSTAHGFSNRAFPTANIEIRTVNYFDDHDFDNNGTADLTYTTQSLPHEGLPGVTFGRSTGSKVAIENSANWLIQYVFYDQYGRPIQVKKNNSLNSTIADHTTNTYHLGRLNISKTFHHGGGTNQVTTVTRTEYDAGGRPTKVLQSLNGGTEILLVKYEYNALGQLVDKKLHEMGSVGSGVFVQSVDFRYNILGQLASINNAQLTTGENNDDTNDYFGMEFLYNGVESGLNNTSRFNGNISAIKWKSPGTTTGVANQRSYKLTYDKSNKLTSAVFQVRGTSSWNKEVNAHDELVTYDLNGNIKTLQRKQRKHQLSSSLVASYTNELMDNLTYTYSSTDANSLLKVVDSSGPTGFDNGGSGSSDDFEYDATGRLLSDLNKDISAISYNLDGKPIQVQFNDGRKITYTYSAVGIKLGMDSYATGASSPTTMTRYVDNFVYVDGGLAFFGSPEGRVVKTGSSFEYQYAISDHQGNTRVVFSSVTPAVDQAATGFEADPGTLQNFPTGGNRSSLGLFNKTNGGTYSQLLNGGYNSQIGVGKSFIVYPGDKVKINAYAKYESGGGSNPMAFATALLQAFNLPAPAPGETGTPSYALNTWGGFVDGGAQQNPNPQAFVNVIVFDKDWKLLDAAWDQIDPNAQQIGVSPNVAHDLLSKEYTVKEPGFVFLYVSNNSPVNVYFDDVAITHTPTKVIQYNEYYPFGLQTSSSWTRENHSNNFLYNAGNELNTTTGWYEMFYRGYDPTLGRMLQVDPFAAMYASHTTYNYAVNSPIVFNDPTGGQAYAGRSEYVPGMNYNTWRRTQSNYADLSFMDWSRDFGNYTGGGGYWQDEGYVIYGDKGQVIEGGVKTRWVPDDAQQGAPLQAIFGFSEWNGSAELAIAALKPTFDAAGYFGRLQGGRGDVPLYLKKNLFKSYLSRGNNALYIGRVSSTTAIRTANTLSKAAPALGALGVATNVYDIFQDGQLTAGDGFQAINTGLMIAFPVYGVAYGLVDLGFSMFTDQSLTDRIKSGIDSNVSGSISVGW